MSAKCKWRTDAAHQKRSYSITTSARERNEGEIESPMSFAVLRLMASSNLVGCCTGRSIGSMPRRTLST